MTDVWFSGKSGAPPWAWRVPTVLPRELGIDRPMDDHEWDGLPPRRAVTAAGLRVIRAVKCEVGKIDRCPYGRNWCGRYHPRPLPWRRMAVDDVAAMVPAGQIVLLRFYGVTMPGTPRRDAVFLVPPDDLRMYEELTGWSGSASFQPDVEDRPRRPSGPAECRNDQPMLPRQADATASRTAKPCHIPGCGQAARLYPAGWLCDSHKPVPRW